MIVVFEVQISNLKQQPIVRDDALHERINGLESQLANVIEHCNKQCNCNSTVTTRTDSSSYDDQELHMKLDNITAAQMKYRVDLIMLSLHCLTIGSR